MPDPRKKFISDKKYYDKRLKSYQDSLAVYDRHKTPGDSIPFAKYSGKNAPTDSYLKWKDTPANMKATMSDEKINPVGMYVRKYAKGTHRPKDGATTIIWPKYVKPTVEPVLSVEKTNVKPKTVSKPTPGRKPQVQKSLPKTVDKIAYDASGTTVYVTMNGKTTSMPKKNFGNWVTANQQAYNRYRKR
jgi:hypothetical protein